MSRKSGLLVLSLVCIFILGLGLAVALRGPLPQSPDPARQAIVLEENESYTLLYVPEVAVAATYAQQWAKGYHCTGLGTRVSTGVTNGFYWACRDGEVPAQEDTKE